MKSNTTKYSILPPKESLSNLVSLESRIGTWALFSARALIHFPNALSERFIDLASSSVCPSLPGEKTDGKFYHTMIWKFKLLNLHYINFCIIKPIARQHYKWHWFVFQTVYNVERNEFRYLQGNDKYQMNESYDPRR